MTIEEVRKGMMPQLDVYVREYLVEKDEPRILEIRKNYRHTAYVYNNLLVELFGNEPTYTDRHQFPRKLSKYMDMRMTIGWEL